MKRLVRIAARSMKGFPFTLALACGAAATPSARSGPPPVERITPADTELAADDGRLHLFRSYFALEQVGRSGHHFTVWYRDIEPSHCEATVIDGDVTLTGCMFGGMSVPPPTIPAVPTALTTEQELVVDAVKRKDPKASHIRVAYGGNYRELVLSEMIVVTGARMTAGLGGHMTGNPVGWHTRIHLKADAALTKIEGLAAGRSESGYGMITIPSEAARIDHRPGAADDGQRLVTHGMVRGASLPDPLVQRTLELARAIAEGKPVPTIAPLLAAPVDLTIPPSYDQPLTLVVTLYARHKDFQKQEHRELVLRLRPREAAIDGRALASTETDVDGVHVKVTATMSGFAPTDSNPKTPLAYEGRDMEAKIDLHVEDNRGNVVDRSYPARGKVVGEAPALATPAGLVLPGTSSPSKAAEALRFTWPGHGAATQLDVYINPTLMAAPLP